MSLLQRYIFGQVLVPLVVALVGLASLALLTQSLSTLELVVKNRQSAGTFFWITLLALPQLVSIILPIAVLLASLFALNRLNMDSELIVARSTGVGPWDIASPVLRVAALAAVVHLLVNLFVQPTSYREMRASLLDVRTDIASKMVQAGEFASPVEDLTIYAQTVAADGGLTNIVIHDDRRADTPVTYVAEEGRVLRSGKLAFLELSRGAIQERIATDQLDVIKFAQHRVDLTDAIAADTVLRLKTSDRYLHELFDPRGSDMLRADEYAAEGHARLASPLYGLALALIALVALARGKHQRLGYGRRILVAAVIGFGIRLVGFSATAAAEGNAALNALQYAIPGATILVCLALLLARRSVELQQSAAPEALSEPAPA